MTATHARQWRITVSVSCVLAFVALVWFGVFLFNRAVDKSVREAVAKSNYESCLRQREFIPQFNMFAAEVARKTRVDPFTVPVPTAELCKARRDAEAHG